MSTSNSQSPDELRIERLTLALKASNEGIWDWQIASDSLYYSDRVLHFLGYQQEDMPHLFKEPVKMIYRDDLNDFRSALTMALTQNGSLLFSQDSRVKHHDSGWRWLRIRGIIQRDDAGNAVRMTGSIIDINRRKTTEEKLQDERHLFRLLSDNLPMNIFFKNMLSEFVVVNKSLATRFGFEKTDDALGLTDQDIFKGSHADEALADEKRILETGKPILDQLEHETHHDDGDKWVITSKMPWIDRKGKLKGTFGISSDVTEMVETQAKLIKTAAKLKRRNQEMEDEIKLAREIQSALLPTSFPTAQANGVSLQFSHRFQPSGDMAGDFYEVIDIKPGIVGLLICDVMGHGVRSALVVSMLRGMMEKARQYANQPATFLGQLNEGLTNTLQTADITLFATAAYMVVDLHSSTTRTAIAGHPYPLVLGRNGIVRPAECTQPGPALGLLPNVTYTQSEGYYDYIQNILLYTDGVIEVENEDEQQWQDSGLTESLERHSHLELNKRLDAILEDARAFGGKQGFADDVCILGVEFNR
ncbi:SpoIIE family protein phosphatase [Persicirhabdus sediminis]|uniref:SpoIIE family protein phosphatase n=1 Tax=Persicirhabdus sediminis TaxID=454144 RepID=A0A8J7MFR5_9BACT|nr:SpoIIE family protein phosphatase [Persicirhabdus sediminis]MBK1792651.1 SpoIIE family protein phosphatase [Persicirhabdus sediminis]